MSKRTLSGSEIHAHSKNRHEQNYLKEKLNNLSQSEFQSLDSNRIEKQKWREFLIDNARNTGWSPMAMRPHIDNDDCFDDPGSPASPTSPRKRFELQFIEKYQKPWAYSFKPGSHNKVYRELTEVGESSKKNIASPRAALSSTSSEAPGATRPRLAQHVPAVKGLERARSAWGRAEKLLTPRQPNLSLRPQTSMNLTENNELSEPAIDKTDTYTQSSKPSLTRQVSMVKGVERAKTAWFSGERLSSVCDKETELEKSNSSTEDSSNTVPKLARQVTVLQGLHKSKDAWICSICGGDKRQKDPLDNLAHTALVYKGLEKAKAALERLLPKKSENTENQIKEPEKSQPTAKNAKCSCKGKTSRVLSKTPYPWTKNGHIKTGRVEQPKKPSKRPQTGVAKVRRVGVVSMEGNGVSSPILHARKKPSNMCSKLKSTSSETYDTEETFLLTKDFKKMDVTSANQMPEKRVDFESKSINGIFANGNTEKGNKMNAEDASTSKVVNVMEKNGSGIVIDRTNHHLTRNMTPSNEMVNIDSEAKVALAYSQNGILTLQPKGQDCVDPLIPTRGGQNQTDTNRIGDNQTLSEPKGNVKKGKIPIPIYQESNLNNKSDSHNGGKNQGRILIPRSDDVDGEIGDKTNTTDEKNRQQSKTTAKKLWHRTSLPIDTLNFLEKIKGESSNPKSDATKNVVSVSSKPKSRQSVVKPEINNEASKDKSLTECRKISRGEDGDSRRPTRISDASKEATPQGQDEHTVDEINHTFSEEAEKELSAVATSKCKDQPGSNDLLILIKPSRQKVRKPVQKKEENVFYKIARVMLKKVKEKRALKALAESMEGEKEQEESTTGTDSKSEEQHFKGKRQSVALAAYRKLSMVNAFYNPNAPITPRGSKYSRTDSIAENDCEASTNNKDKDETISNNNNHKYNTTDSPAITRKKQSKKDKHDNDNDNANNNTDVNPNSIVQEEEASNNNLKVEGDFSDTASSVNIVSLFNTPAKIKLNDGVLDYDTSKLNFTDTSKCIEDKGVRIKNYVSPQKRYKTAVTDKHRRGASLKWHSVEGATVVAHQSQDKSRMAEIVFPKQARQKMLTKMVEENHTKPQCHAAQLAEAAMRKRIEQFLQSVEPLCQSPKN